MTTKEALAILEKLAPDISKNSFFPNKTREQIEEMGRKAGERFLTAFSKKGK